MNVIVKPFHLPLLNREAKLYVMLPEKMEMDASYPVLFFHDGQNVFFDRDASFGVSWGVKEIFEQNDMPKMVVVGLSCANGLNRLDEYNPFIASKAVSFGETPRLTGGKGDAYLHDIIDTVLPYLKEHYPVDLNNITIAGSSMGGHISLYATLTYPKVFKNALCLSNAFWISEEAMVNYIKNLRKKHKGFIYMDTGDNESDDFDYLKANDRVYKALNQKGIKATYRIIPGGIHHESDWNKRIKDIILKLK